MPCVEFTASSLAKVGMEIVDLSRGLIRCKVCGLTVGINKPLRGERRPNGWWKCPNGCNGDY